MTPLRTIPVRLDALDYLVTVRGDAPAMVEQRLGPGVSRALWTEGEGVGPVVAEVLETAGFSQSTKESDDA